MITEEQLAEWKRDADTVPRPEPYVANARVSKLIEEVRRLREENETLQRYLETLEQAEL